MSYVKRSQTVASFTSPVAYKYRGVWHRTWSPHLYTVRRITSLPDLYRRSSKPAEYPPWRTNLSQWSEWDDYWLDRRFFRMPRYTSHYTWPYRRQKHLDTPSGFWWNYPSTYHYPKLHVKYDYFDSYYWRRLNDVQHLRPTYAPFRQCDDGPKVPLQCYTQYVKYHKY